MRRPLSWLHRTKSFLFVCLFCILSDILGDPGRRQSRIFSPPVLTLSSVPLSVPGSPRMPSLMKRLVSIKANFFHWSVSESKIRDLKIRRRRRQRERHKTIGLISKNNSSARALYGFVHFFAVLCKTTTWTDQIQGFVENASTRRRIFHSPS